MKFALPAQTVQPKSAAKSIGRALGAIEGSRAVAKTFKAIHASTRFSPSAASEAFKHVVVKK